jgi:16S rRNA (guanine527-N7)-methyltransferase
MQIIEKYFQGLSTFQKEQFGLLEPLYTQWNQRINVISRKDIRNLYVHHVLHSLSIAKILTIEPGTTIIDAGTGGGFPGIPLAIMFPEVQFLLVDSMAKKLMVVNAVITSLGLQNCAVRNNRIEDMRDKADFIVSRAVTEFASLIKWAGKNVKPEGKNTLPNGLLVLKGGDLQQEISQFKGTASLFSLSNFFEERYFEGKKLIHFPIG